MSRLLVFNKPFGTLCRFGREHGHPSLADWIDVPDVYPAGRLDRDSEGLVVLTDDGGLAHRITHPRHKLAKTYWVQVAGEPDDAALRALRDGVALDDGRTRPARVRRIEAPASLWPRDPPVPTHRHGATSWLQTVLTEGRNRQLRRMTAAVGHPTLRLVRIAVGPWSLGALRPGEWRRARAPARSAPATKPDRAR